jgi:nucleoside-triphosphatase THEP1
MNNLTKSQRSTLKKNILKYNLPYPTDFRSRKNRDIINANLGKIEYEIESAKIDARKEQLRQASRRYRQKKREAKQVKRWIGNVRVEVKYMRSSSQAFRGQKYRNIEKEFYKTATPIRNYLQGETENDKTQYSNDLGYNVDINVECTKQQLPREIDMRIQEFVDNKQSEYSSIASTQYKILGSYIKEYNKDDLIPYEQIKMRDINAPKIDGFVNDWGDTNTGRCVFDYIITLLGNVKGFKTICNYEKLEQELQINDDEDLQNNGVSIANIDNFCKKYDLPLYVIGDFGKTDIIHKYKPEKLNAHYRTLCFRLSNNHIYPILDKDKVKSIIALKNVKDNVISTMVMQPKQENCDGGFKKALEEGLIEYTNGSFDKLTQLIKNNNILPNTDTIKIRDGQLKSFHIGNTQYICDELRDNTQLLCELFGITYKGQSFGSVVIEIYKQVYNTDELPTSSYNNIVKETLLLAKKNRDHTGYLKDYEDDDNIKTIDINKCYRKCLYEPVNDWLIYDFNNCWEEFDGEIKNALYMVETDDIMLLKGNDIYTGDILKVAQQNGITFTITKQLLPKKTISKDYFRKYIDTIIEKFNTKLNEIDNKIEEDKLKDIQFKYKCGYNPHKPNTLEYFRYTCDKKNCEDCKILHNKMITTKKTPQHILDRYMQYFELYKKTEKLAINNLSGLLGRDKQEQTIASINSDIQQVLYFISRYNIENCYMYKLPDVDYYLYGLKKNTIKHETTIPIYLQIIDQARIMIYELTKKIEQIGGEVLARKVDCVVCRNLPNNYQNVINGFGTNWGEYHKDDKKPVLFDYETPNNKDFSFINNWNDYNEYNDSDMYNEIINKIDETKGMLIRGDGGVGKSYIINKITERYGNKVLKLAFTNIASINIKGQTIHRTLHIKNNKITSKSIEYIKNYKYIIIDEISMLPKNLWKFLYYIKSALPNIIFVLLGDNKQIPPIEEEKDDIIDDYFNHPAIKYLTNYNRITLTKTKRYDMELKQLSYDVYNEKEIELNNYPEKLNARRNICYFNNTRKRINKLWNLKENVPCSLFIPSIENDNYTQDMYLYHNCPVIARKTEKNGLFVNSETFTIEYCNNTNICLYNIIPDENGNVKKNYINVPTETFAENFALNYCSTTHKTQGNTITEDFNIYDWKFMDKKLRYTAITRARNINQIGIRAEWCGAEP